jgi:endoglucanase
MLLRAPEAGSPDSGGRGSGIWSFFGGFTTEKRPKSFFPVLLIAVILLSSCLPELQLASPTPAGPAPVPTPTRLPALAANADIAAKNARLGRGINLGNELMAPLSSGQAESKIQLADFALIRAAGFAHVRLPVRWGAHAAAEAPYRIDPAFLARVDQVVGQAFEQGLAVVLAFSGNDELYADPAGQGPRFTALWRQIAAHYQGYAPELYFELLDAPQGQLTAEKWNALLVQALAEVRTANPTRAVLVGPAGGYSIAQLSALLLPQDANLIVCLDYFTPVNFTRQNDPALRGSRAWLGSAWYGSQVEKLAVQSDLDAVANWAGQSQRPVYISAFGSYVEALLEYRIVWTGFVARSAEERHFSWAYWDFASGYGAYDRPGQQWITPLLKALIP